MFGSLKIYLIVSVIFVVYSCTNTKISNGKREHGDCNVAYLSLDNLKNDTNRLLVTRTYVFDTTAKMIKGIIVDQASGLGIDNVEVNLFHYTDQIKTISNKSGEFKIFENILLYDWNMIVRKPGYICMYIVNVIQTGGQEVVIKLQKE